MKNVYEKPSIEVNGFNVSDSINNIATSAVVDFSKLSSSSIDDFKNVVEF